ncbi:MAG: hypothetical protein QI223_01400, partial [Candidatus Korarchaeota archaeon]|nr:hypothetical protein [Candidatus Korarchaeota archaeon]
DVGDISITANRPWRVEVYRDVLGDDAPGFYTSDDQFNFNDDVLIAYDGDGQAGGDIATNSTWDWVNRSEDTFGDNIPDTGMLGNQTSPDNWVNVVFVVYVNNSEVLAGDAYHLVVRGTSYNDWVEDPEYPNIPYDDDSLYHDTAHLVANALETPCGFISPDALDSSGAPEVNLTVWFVQDWVNRAPMTDRGNVKIVQPAGLALYLYRDEGLNDQVGAHADRPIDSDDVLLAADYDGDGSWDFVSPDYDAGGDGIPDTGDLPPHGGYARMIFEVVVPKGAPPGTLTVVVRGCSNWEWVNEHPDLEYCADEIFHDEASMTIEVLPYRRPDLRGSLNLTLGMIGDDVYEYPAVEQLLNRTSNPASPANFTISVQNDGNVEDTIRLTGPTVTPLSRVTYFLNGANVTDLVGGPGLDLTLAPGEEVLLTVLLTPTTYRHLMVDEVAITSTSAGDPAKLDSVKLTTTIVDEAPPQVSLLEPGASETLEWARRHTFRVNLSDDTGLENATLLIMRPDRSVVMELSQRVSGRCAEVEWTTPALGPGNYLWAVMACDNVSAYGPFSSNCALSEHREFTVLPKPPVPGAVISGTIDAEPAKAAPGDAVNLRVRVFNEGAGSADQVVVQLAVPEGLALEGPCSRPGGGGVLTDVEGGSAWIDLGRLDPGGSASAVCTLRVQSWAEEGVYVLRALYRRVLLDSASVEVAAPAIESARRLAARILVSLEVDPPSTLVEERTRVSILVKNVGAGKSGELILRIALPEGLSPVEGTFSVGGRSVEPTPVDGGLGVVLGALGPGDGVNVTLLVSGEVAGTHEIRACVGGVCAQAALEVAEVERTEVSLSGSSRVSEGLTEVTVTIEVVGGEVTTDLIISIPEGADLIPNGLTIDGTPVQAVVSGGRAVVAGVRLPQGRHELRVALNSSQASPGVHYVEVRVGDRSVSVGFEAAPTAPTGAPTETPSPTPVAPGRGFPVLTVLGVILALAMLAAAILVLRRGR